MTQFIDVQLKAEDLHKHFSKILLKHLKNFWNYAKKNTLVSGNAGDEKNLQPDQIYFFSQFSGDILFSSLVSFTIFVFFFFFFLLVFFFFDFFFYFLFVFWFFFVFCFLFYFNIFLLFFFFFLLVCLFFAFFFCLFACFLLFFACLFVFCFFLLVCLFFEIKNIYSDTYSTMRASDHKIFTQPISGIVYFFWLLFFLALSAFRIIVIKNNHPLLL